MHPPGKSTPGVDFIKNDIRSLLDDISGSGFGFFCLAPRNVLVADECHGLTKEQAELFLKYIEDADEHNYFIFCTTEPNDVLPALVDRCIINLKFDRVPNVEIFNLLRDICHQEQLEPNEEVLKKIAEESSGKPRVAVNKLQQSYYAGNLKRRTMQE